MAIFPNELLPEYFGGSGGDNYGSRCQKCSNNMTGLETHSGSADSDVHKIANNDNKQDCDNLLNKRVCTTSGHSVSLWKRGLLWFSSKMDARALALAS